MLNYRRRLPHCIRSAEELHEVIAYVENNPVKAGLVDVKERSPGSSARRKAGSKKRPTPRPPPNGWCVFSWSFAGRRPWETETRSSAPRLGAETNVETPGTG